MEKLWEWQRTSVRIDSGMRPKPATTSRTRSWSASTTSMNHRSKSMNIMKIQVFWYITPCTMVTIYQSTQRNIPDYVKLQAGCRENLKSRNGGISGFRYGVPKVRRTESENEEKGEKGWEQRNNKNKQWLIRKDDERSLPLRVIVCQNVVLQRQLQLWEVFTHPSETKRAFMWTKSALARQDTLLLKSSARLDNRIWYDGEGLSYCIICIIFGCFGL